MKPLLPAIFFLTWLGALADLARAAESEVFVRRVEEYPDARGLMVNFKGHFDGMLESVSNLDLVRPGDLPDAEWNQFVESFRAVSGQSATLTINLNRLVIAIRGGSMHLPATAVHIKPIGPPPQPSGQPGNTIVTESPSPDGRFKAIVFRRDSGTTPGLTTQISLLAATETLPNAPGNIFIAPYDLDFRLRWNNRKPSDLIISGQFPAPGDEVLRLKKFQDVRIFYRNEIKTQATRVRITAVEPSGAVMLTVHFDGAWTLPPPASSSQIPRRIPQPARNAVMFHAYFPEEEKALADLTARFRAVLDKTVTFTILHPGGQIQFYEDTPMLSISLLTVTIEE